MGSIVYNPFNASASSPREYFGVPPTVVGWDRVAQASSLIMGGLTSGVNTSIIDEFMALQGISPNRLQYPDWATPNDPTASPSEALAEFMLDVQTQHAVAPQAYTNAISSILTIEGLEEALSRAQLSGDQIRETLQAFQWAVPGDTPGENLTALYKLDTMEKRVAGDFYSDYLRAFVRNLTDASGATMPQVLSWSWNT